jgi:hypothetical protein
MLPKVHSVWIGPRLGLLNAACLKSFVNAGHEVTLHTYDRVEDLPDGIQTSDANALFPADKLLQYPGGSFAISANLIRYRILSWGLGMYVDADVYCLRPIEDADYLIGYEDNKDVNTAVMKLPTDSPVLADLCAIKEGWSPPWRPDSPVKKLAEYEWGTTGPRALTYYLQKHDMKHHALPIDIFYPVHHEQTALFAEETLTVDDLVTSRTRYIHMYQSNLSRRFNGDPPPRSVAGQLIAASGL